MNVLVTCREVTMMRTMFYIVIVIKDTKHPTGVYSLITLLLIDVILPVPILILVLN